MRTPWIKVTTMRFSQSLAMTALIVSSSAVHAARQPTQRETPSKPNILLILADDWGWGDLGCHGHPYVRTPNIDRLAREGTDFHRFTVASGVCSPSRTAVMTGHFPARYNIDGHFAWVPSNAKRNMPDWLDPQVPTLPRFLKSAGYATAHFGKWHIAMVPKDAGFDYDDGMTSNGGGEIFGDGFLNIKDYTKAADRYMKENNILQLWVVLYFSSLHYLRLY